MNLRGLHMVWTASLAVRFLILSASGTLALWLAICRFLALCCVYSKHSPPTGGGLPRDEYTVSWIQSQRIVAGQLDRLYDNDTVRFVKLLSAGGTCDEHELIAIVDLATLMANLHVNSLRAVGRFFGLSRMSALRVNDIRKSLTTYSRENNVVTVSAVFRRPKNSTVNPFHVSIPVRERECAADAVPTIAPEDDPVSVKFPPQVMSVPDIATVVEDWCQQISSFNLSEEPCAVCACLVLSRDVVRVRQNDDMFRILADLSSSEIYPVLCTQGRRGDCYAVCAVCFKALRRKEVPQLALANGRWIGDVPAQLASLNFVEKLLVARYRHNVCIVRVYKGGYKMRANAVVFSQPVGKVSSVLPPSRVEMDEVLAVLFTGPTKPTASDFKRTPLLIRKHFVWRALMWLKTHNPCYNNVVLSRDNLNSYPENEPPVAFMYQEEDGCEPLESIAVNESDRNKGSQDGSCPLTVQGLTSEDLSSMGHNQMVAIGLRHLRSKGSVLTVGHGSAAQDLYNDPDLYPGLFPWLFPYGLGGYDNSRMVKYIPRVAQTRALLMYYDRRFQVDEYFPFIVFNQHQVRQGWRGGYLLTERKNFTNIADKILSLNVDSLDALIERCKEKGYARPENEDERKCYELLNYVDHVASHVPGSSTQKKYQRNEIKSLIIEHGVPIFFVTFAPPPSKSPVCLYFCGEPIDLEDFCPQLSGYTERICSVTSNPVACARFFHLLVETFIKVILRAGTDTAGLFGKTSAYYGTVEAQGRLALHLHMLLWVEGSYSPQEIRDRLVLNDGEFRDEITRWLEFCCQGQFSTGSSAVVRARIESKYRSRDGYDVDADVDEDEVTTGDPTAQLPQPPRLNGDARGLEMWFQQVVEITDEILYRSNLHSPRHNRGCKPTADSDCRARMPRDVREVTIVDIQTGAILLKKGEPWLNTFCVVLSYLLRCNTDVTCLLSGTMVRAVIAYVTDYVTKMSLKTHTVFEAVKMIFSKHFSIISDCENKTEAARRMLTKIVNALTVRLEMGGPMVSLHLLGNPDHYTDKVFKVFFWSSYEKTIRRAWDIPIDDDRDAVVIGKGGQELVPYDRVNDYVYRPTQLEYMSLADFLRLTEVVYVRSCVTAKNVRKLGEDDAFAAAPADDVETYDAEQYNESTELMRFRHGHPKQSTHAVGWVSENSKFVLNYVGAVLPRRPSDEDGENEYYYRTMLTLFSPRGWRTGKELKHENESWKSAFSRTRFSTRNLRLMANMNVLYECADAKDDFAAQRRSKDLAKQLSVFFGHSIDNDAEEHDGDFSMYDDLCENDILQIIEESMDRQKKNNAKKTADADALKTFLLDSMAEGRELFPQRPAREIISQLPDFVSSNLGVKHWKEVMKSAQQEMLDFRTGRHAATVSDNNRFTGKGSERVSHDMPGEVRVMTKQELDAQDARDTDQVCRQDMPTFLPPLPFELGSNKLSDAHAPCYIANVSGHIELISSHFSLNTKQKRAFVTAAMRVVTPRSPPLRMFLGGMGGTGKSRVINALVAFFDTRGEPYRYLVVAPTGSAAANINGSTYHSVLNIRKGQHALSASAWGKIKDRCLLVELIIGDEASMMACGDLFLISNRLAQAFHSDESFGGRHVILAGDFAQLPPAGSGYPLYSSKVGVSLHGTTARVQRESMGRALWHMFTTVVLLNENMRQKELSEANAAFRTALENMRFGKCTPDDIALLRTRVMRSDRNGPHLRHPDFEDVSVITGLNLHRDVTNEVEAQRFCTDNDLVMHTFYSVDKWSDPKNVDSLRELVRQYAFTIDPSEPSSTLAEATRTWLWSLPPRDTKHLAGKLTLARGMPVLLKHNEATELCATNGAEGYVVGWDVDRVWGDKEKLNVLFVLLRNPARDVTLPGLPKNVIAVPPVTDSMRVEVIGNLKLNLSRQQVPVLPNFAMTDYGSQGRTRPLNPVDLRNCRTHMNVYTALSRSTCLEGTLITHNFDTAKITSGLSADLLREFRHLEILAAATREAFEKTLPFSIDGVSRSMVIHRYQVLHGLRYVPPNVHPALHWTNAPLREIRAHGEIPVGWKSLHDADRNKRLCDTIPADRDAEVQQPLMKKAKIVISENRCITSASKVRTSQQETAQVLHSGEHGTGAAHHAPFAAVGYKWDALNWSCCADSVFLPLLNAFKEFGLQLSVLDDHFGEIVSMLYCGFRASSGPMLLGDSLERERDSVRRRLYEISAHRVSAIGAIPVSIDRFISTMFSISRPYGRVDAYCENCCLFAGSSSHPLDSVEFTLIGDELSGRRSLSQLVNELFDHLHACPRHCRRCLRPNQRVLHIERLPPILFFHLPTYKLTLDSAMVISGLSTVQTWRLIGVVYHGNLHFTARYIDKQRRVWSHDSVSQRRFCCMEGDIDDMKDDLFTLESRRACVAMYVLDVPNIQEM